ncbi:MAG: Xaa-Pro dipeptidase [Deltaproteobacteria bacterium]|nr:Xaa-Pro dipeptidase [Deltaproteobacteria bacterium]
MTNPLLYCRHLETLDQHLGDAILRAGRRGVKLTGVVFHAGRQGSYHRDDQEIPFRATPHFRRYLPLAGPEHVVLARPGKRPQVVRVAPKDFWYEVAPPAPSYWQDAVELAEVESLDQVTAVTGNLSQTAYVGNSPEAAAALKIAADLHEPAPLMLPLDWHRAEKTEHEVALLELAALKAAAGHRRAREAFVAGASEREIHWAYLEATGHLEAELPFETIVAYDDKTAILHYQNKRAAIRTPMTAFMLDAGAAADGYASDITRTWLKPDADPTHRALLFGLDSLQRDLVGLVTAGRSYEEIHHRAHQLVAGLLRDTGILRATPEQGVARGVTRTFFPHGVGHHLGLQVHDVGGHQADIDGGVKAPPPEHRYLRNTRSLAPGHVVTIEPGIYFIPMLLAALRATPHAALVDWKLVDRLTPMGGMRIEDDVLCTTSAPRDLTRPLIVGPRDL